MRRLSSSELAPRSGPGSVPSSLLRQSSCQPVIRPRCGPGGHHSRLKQGRSRMPDGQDWEQQPAQQPVGPETSAPGTSGPDLGGPGTSGEETGQTGSWGQQRPPAADPGWGSLGQSWQVPGQVPGQSLGGTPPGGAGGPGQSFASTGAGPGAGPGPMTGDMLPTISAPTPGSRRQGVRGWTAMAIASAVVLVGAGTGASLMLAGASGGGGESSPAAAVQQMIDALNKSDVVGVLGMPCGHSGRLALPGRYHDARRKLRGVPWNQRRFCGWLRPREFLERRKHRCRHYPPCGRSWLERTLSGQG